jgi:hypothetical protein
MGIAVAFLGAAVYFIVDGLSGPDYGDIALSIALALYGSFALYLAGGITYLGLTGERPPGAARLAVLSRSLLERDFLGRRRGNRIGNGR